MEILGQPHVLHYLTEGIKRDRLSPSLLFVGIDGIGKRSCALELAKCFTCLNPRVDDAGLRRCDGCAACKKVAENNHADVLFVDRIAQALLIREKPEAQTAIKIETVRHIDRFLNLKPFESHRRIVIIDEAHRLTNESANALLKLLEEPPHHAQIVLIANDEHALPATVLSRCAVLRFRPLPVKVLAEWLENEHAVSESNAFDFAERSAGSFQKAVQIKNDDSEKFADLSDYTLDEFFEMLATTNWRKEGRKNAELAVIHLIEAAQKKLSSGDVSQTKRLEAMLAARQQIDRHVPPKLVLQNLYLKIEGEK